MSFQGKIIAVHNSLPLRMHATPFLEARVVSKLPVGVIVDIEAVEGSWLCVYDRATGHTGWVDKNCVQEVPLPQPDSFPAPCSIEPVGMDWTDTAWRLGGFAALLAIFMFAVASAMGVI